MSSSRLPNSGMLRMGVLGIISAMHAAVTCWEYVRWGARSSRRTSSAQAGGWRGALPCWRERGGGGWGRAIIIQGGCRGGAAGQSRPGGRGRWGELGRAGEQGRATPVSEQE
jgi:hypothetical protein